MYSSDNFLCLQDYEPKSKGGKSKKHSKASKEKDKIEEKASKAEKHANKQKKHKRYKYWLCHCIVLLGMTIYS